MPSPTDVHADEPLDARERRLLCDLFLELGPDAPTLCEGWDTLDLAAHLLIRERDPRAGVAILGGSRFRSMEERLMGRAQERGLPDLVDRLRQGPPAVPWRLPGLRTPLNLNEWFVHHEDVRRADGRGPREIDDRLDAALWANLRSPASRFLARGVKGLGVRLVTPNRGERTLRKGAPEVVLTGPAQELLLHLFGRTGHDEVDVGGTDEARAAWAAARLGI